MIGVRALFTGLLLASAAVATCGAAKAPTVAAPTMALNSVEVTGDQDACVQQAANALKKNNFGTHFAVLNNRTLYGEQGAYIAAVRCVAEKAIAFVAVAGPSTDLTAKYAEAIRNGF